MEFILRQQQGKLPYLYLPFHGKGGAWAFFTTRLGGVSRGCYSSLNLGYHTGDQADAVTVNRRLAAQTLGINDERFVTVDQVHGDRSERWQRTILCNLRGLPPMQGHLIVDYLICHAFIAKNIHSFYAYSPGSHYLWNKQTGS
jgi:hypothetical protein